MMRLPVLHDLQGKLLELPAIVDRLQEHDAGFTEAVRQWLSATEAVLKANRMTGAATLAALRGMVVAAERGATPVGMPPLAKPTPRKVREAAGAEALRKAEEVVSAAIQPDFARFDEAERLMQRIATLALAKGHVRPPGGASRTEWLASVWAAICGDPEMAAAAAHAQGLTGAYDVLVVLDRALPGFG